MTVLVREGNLAARELPQDVISLIHHVHLNEQGWWRKGVAQVLAGLLWKAEGAWTAVRIKNALQEQFNVAMALDDLKSCLKSMVSSGTVNEVRTGEYRLSEVASRELSKQAAEGEAEVQRAKDYFLKELGTQCGSALDANQAWQAFVEELTAAVRQTGANTFNLLTGVELERHEDWLVGFVQRFGTQYIDCLKRVVASFFSPVNPDGKQYVLRLLSAYFFVESTQLNRRTIESIDAKRSKRKLKLYLDSNFLFSVLGLHDNPADDAAISLLELAKSAKAYIDISFVVAPHTLDETQRTVYACMEHAKRVQVSRVLQTAAASAPLPSALRKFFHDGAKAGQAVSPEDYFGPYARNLKTVLQRTGIIVDNDINVSEYRLDQRVIDDEHWENERQQAQKTGRQKSYEAIEHDIILWYAVNDQRPKHTESPFDAEAWVVTVDMRLAAFDRRKTPRYMGVPTVLLPSNLAQLIQFWVPRSDQLEATLLDSLKLPLFFREFDRDDERVTMRILSALSRYRDVEDLGVETVRDLLVNEALRQRIEAGVDASVDDDLAMVQEEVIQSNRKLKESLSASQVKVGVLTGETEALRQAVSDAANNAAREAAGRIDAEARATEETKLREEAEAQVAAERTEREGQTTAIVTIQTELLLARAERARERFIYRYCIGIPLVAMGFCLAISICWKVGPSPTVQPYWPQVAYAIVGVITVFFGAWHALKFIKKHPELGEWWLTKYFKSIAVVGGGFFGSGVLPGFVGDIIKKWIGIS